ncbi:uncharacterized protein MKK02DRAFT_41084 [Dioszegia hungarica]|uniref:Histone acetyltransferase n=1 Tax=Dioszegia hungarica TaxID=4972 RepID=A0AA38LSN2_9TREE|nr:uncharacterized protein MKK02DRAFT_41084 [Dioszegia hungarica]KAI9632774.1 hypothetical protein MKK02DRAFT_41084 [Dioszegia hungarica]
MSTSTSLRDHLLSQLSALPNAQKLKVVALTSSPTRTSTLFPHTITHPRCFQVDYFVVLGTEVEDSPPYPESSTTPSPRLVLTSAISAHLYILPHSQTSILYISKVDSSAFPLVSPNSTSLPSPSPEHSSPPSYPTFSSPLPAPPRSSESTSSREPNISGARLCGWWKGVYEAVAEVLVDQGRMEPGEVYLAYYLPPNSAYEASAFVGAPRRPLPVGLGWKYEPPFATRFLDEVAHEKAEGGGDGVDGESGNGAEAGGGGAGAAGKVKGNGEARGAKRDEKREEQAEVEKNHSTAAPSASEPSHPSHPLKPAQYSDKTSRRTTRSLDLVERQQTHAALARITPAEFWERIGFRGECAFDVTGFFSLGVSSPSPSVPAVPATATQTSADPAPAPGHLSPAIVTRMQAALMNTDFHDLPNALEGSEAWLVSVAQIVGGETGEEAMVQHVEGVVEAKTAAEVEAISGSGGKRGRVEEVVTMLQPRKKKKA